MPSAIIPGRRHCNRPHPAGKQNQGSKTMNKKTIITSLTILATFALAGTGFARFGTPGPGNHMGRGYNCDHRGPGAGPALTTEQKKTVQTIEDKYEPKVAAGREAIEAKAKELELAYEKDSTTVAELNRIRDGLITLRQKQWHIRKSINDEISAAIGTEYFAMGPNECDGTGRHMGRHMRQHMGRMGGMGMGGWGPGMHRCNW